MTSITATGPNAVLSGRHREHSGNTARHPGPRCAVGGRPLALSSWIRRDWLPMCIASEGCVARCCLGVPRRLRHSGRPGDHRTRRSVSVGQPPSDPTDPADPVDPTDPTADPTDPTDPTADPTADPADPAADPADPNGTTVDPIDPADPMGDPLSPRSTPTIDPDAINFGDEQAGAQPTTTSCSPRSTDLDAWWAEYYPDLRRAVRPHWQGDVYAAYPDAPTTFPGCGEPRTSYEDVQEFVAFYCGDRRLHRLRRRRRRPARRAGRRIRRGNDRHRARPRVRPRHPTRIGCARA